MRFSFPRFPAEFEIPDEWWSKSGMDGFTPSNRGYRSTATATLVPLRDIEPPFRSLECPLDFCGFDRERLISVLKGIATGAEITRFRCVNYRLSMHFFDSRISTKCVMGFIASTDRLRQALNAYRWKFHEPACFLH